MPHNLYLHSALVQTRRIGSTRSERRTACRYNLIDSVVALCARHAGEYGDPGDGGGGVLHARHRGDRNPAGAQAAGAACWGRPRPSVVFAFALICSGQSSTLTGTMAGQIVMEGFLNFRVRPWLRRLITRMLAVTPARSDDLSGGRGGYVPADHFEPGGFEHAAAVRHHSADSFHERQAAHGSLRQSGLGRSSGLDHGGGDHRAEYLAGAATGVRTFARIGLGQERLWLGAIGGWVRTAGVTAVGDAAAAIR